MPNISNQLRQAYDVQDLAFEAIEAFKSQHVTPQGQLVLTKDDATALSQLIKAWDTAQDRVRIHLGKPLPGSLRPEPKRKQVAQVLSVIPEDTQDAQSAG